jgi:hypothetical protein
MSSNMTDCQDGPAQVPRPGSSSGRATSRCRFATLREGAANTAATHGYDSDDRGAA